MQATQEKPYANVQQVARNPFEVLVNRNKYLTKAIMDYNVADALMTVIIGMRDYAHLMHCSAESIRIGKLRIHDNSLFVTYYIHKWQTLDAPYSQQSFEHIASSNERLARLAMDEHNIAKFVEIMQAMEVIARKHKRDIYDMLNATDLDADNLVWFSADTLEMEFSV